MTNRAAVDRQSFVREPPTGGSSRWLIAGLSVLLLHAGFFALLLHRQPPKPEGTSTDAVLVELTPLPAPAPPTAEVAPATPPSVAAPDAAPPPSPTPAPEPSPPPPPPEPTPPPPPEPTPPPPEPTPAPPEPASSTPAIAPPVPDTPKLPVLPKVAAPIELVKPDPVEDARIEARREAKKAEARREAEHAKQRREDKRRRDEARREAREQSGRKAAEIRERASRASAASAASPASLAAWSSAVRSRVVGNVSAQGGAAGSASVSFTVSGAGRIGGVRVISSSDGQAASAARSAVSSIGSVEPPPDHLSKNVTVSIRLQ